MTYFNEVSNLVSKGKLELIVVIAPPRTGSTLLETVISKSSTIDVEVNEPFVNYGHFGEKPSDGYSKIYDEAVKVLSSQGKAILLVKEMSHWIYLDEEYKRLFSLTDKIVFSIRNPLLSTESRIKKYAEPLSIKPRPEVQRWLLNYIAANRSGIDNKFSSTAQDLEIQKQLLNTYAEIMSFKDWESMLVTTFKEQNYRPFTDILTADPSSFTLEQLGWGSLGDEVRFLSNLKKDFLIVDSTDLRSKPEPIAKELSKQLGINYHPNMIGGWHENDFSHFITQKSELDKADQFVWYDTISKSKDIRPPTEKPPEISSFPEPIQEYIRTIAKPIYNNLFNSEKRVRNEGGGLNSSEGKQIDHIEHRTTQGRRK